MRTAAHVNALTAAVAVLATALADVAPRASCTRIGFDKYHDYTEMTDYLTNVTREFPEASSLYSVGKSVLNRELWVVKLTTAADLLGVPNIKIVGNIHGNEPVGREIVLHLIQYLLDNGRENETIRRLLRTTVVHLLPSMNPDGFELSRPQPCPIDVGGGRTVGSRGNARGFDLNRNFPDAFNPHAIPLQPETRAVMEWLKSVPFVMSLGLHGGALVANYPYDDSEDSPLNFNAKTAESLTSDDDVFRFLAKQYARLHPTMHTGQSCTDEMKFKDGITNGAVWYQVIGSMQDYNYAWHGCLEITLEMSCCKYPPASFLESHWDENLTPLVTWMQQSHRGVKGVVTSRPTGKPIPNAAVSVSGRDNAFNTTKDGEYWRILLPGVYRLVVNAAGHDEKTVRVEVPAEGPQPTLMNVSMEPTTTKAKTTTTTRTTRTTVDSSAVRNDGDYAGVESETEATTTRSSRLEDRQDDGDEDSRSVRMPMSVSTFSAAGPGHDRGRYRATETVTPLCLVAHLVAAYSRR